MNNRNGLESIRRGIIKGLSLFWRWLVKPSSQISEAGQYRNARLLSVFVISLFILFLFVNISYALTVPGYHLPPADLIGYGILLVIYFISRTRLTWLSVALLLVMFPMNVFMNVLAGTTLNITATLLFLIPGFVIASIFLSAWGIAIYGLTISALIALLPVIAPGIEHSLSDVLGPLAVSIIVVILLAIAVEHRNHIELARQSELKQAYDNSLESWARALELRDKATEGHSRRVAELTVELAKLCGIHGPALEHAFRGALLHDIGKMAIPDAVLQKPSPLSKAEWELMYQHPDIALNMLADIPYLKPAMEIPLYHHEHWDGQGYPQHLQGENIPLSARIFTLVDTWDALTSDRPYRKAWNKSDALDYIHAQRGILFDPKITDSFIQLLKKHNLV